MATIAWALAASNTKNNDKVQAAKLDASTKEALFFTEKQYQTPCWPPPLSSFAAQPLVQSIQERSSSLHVCWLYS